MKLKLNKIARFFKRHGHQIAAVAAGVGVVVTAVEAGKAGARIQKKVTEIETVNGEPLSTKDKIVLGAKEATVPVISGGATIGAIALGAISGENLAVGLSAVGAAAIKRYDDYRTNVRAIDPKVDMQAKTLNAKDRVVNYIRNNGKIEDDELVLYYDTHTGQTFRGKPNLNLMVEGRLMDIMLRKGFYSENEYRLLMGETIDPLGGDYYGWDQYSFFDQDSYDPHLEIYEEINYTDDGLEYHILSISDEPDADFLGNNYTSISSHFDVR